MSFLQEKQNRQYLTFLACLSLGMLIFTLFSGYAKLTCLNRILFHREQQLASALLDEGISEKTLAAAYARETITKDGVLFLEKIGHSQESPVRYFSYIRNHVPAILLPDFAGVLFWSALLLAGAFLSMRRREALYLKAACMVERYAERDFSVHLPWNQSGTLYRLFSSIDQLAKALQAKCETEHASAEFLKNTLSDISHQLKTPLAALHMYAEIIAAEPDNRDVVIRFSEKSMQSLIRMEELVQNLLKITRLDAGSICFEKRELPVEEVVQRAVEDLRLRAVREKKQIVFKGDVKDKIFCDPAWTGEAIGNLVKNALDHTSEGGKICICWKHSSVALKLSVSDDGCGIAPEDIHHVFKRFYRSRRSSDRQGAGLGLSLAKSIVEGQGGRICVFSEPEQGTVFTLFFLTES